MAEWSLVKKRTKLTIFLLMIFIFILGVFSDHLASQFFSSQQFPAPVRQKGYTYVSPLLYCRYPNTNNSKLISQLHKKLEGYISESDNNGVAQNISVYFHDPTTGEWMSVNGKQQYAIASLVKVPLFMMIYKEADTDPSLLSKKLQFTLPNDNSMENFKPKASEVLRLGDSYSVDDLISRMIKYSDNNAMDLLTSQIKLDQFNSDLIQLNFSPIQGNSQSDILMTVGKYATFFRILYNATYLDPAMSEKALKLLSKTTFTSGIVAGIPENIPVAHKFGERAYASDATKELHDCGIVYYPNHPYMLCIMTKGTNFGSLATVLKTISQKTYDEVKGAYP